MNVTARRVISVFAAMVLVAVVASSPATPALAKKPEGKGPKTTFSIEAEIFVSGHWHNGRSFRAKGAIRDAGSISLDSPWKMFPLTLVGKRGSIYIESDGNTFVIADATGDHTDAIGATGSVSMFYVDVPDAIEPERFYYLTFDGSLAP